MTECATPLWQKCLVTSAYFSYYFGFALAHMLELFVDRDRVPWLGFGGSLLIVWGIYLTPSSPFWLARAGKYESCMHDLLWLRGNVAAAQDELEAILELIDREGRDMQFVEENICETCFRRSVAKSLGLAVVLKMLVGITQLQYLSSNGASSALEHSIGRIQAVAVLFFAIVILGRRRFTITCGIISACNIFAYGLYLKFVTPAMHLYWGVTVLRHAMSMLFLMTNSAFHIVPILVVTEILPTRTRGSVVASAFAVYYFVSNAAHILCAPLFGSGLAVKLLTKPGFFMLLAFFALVGTVVVALMLADKKKYKTAILK